MVKDAPGMLGIRSRNSKGPLRELRSDMNVGTLEDRHGVSFDVRSDMHLGTLRKKLGVESVKELLKKVS